MSAGIYCDCVGAEQEQEIPRWSVIRAEIGKGAKLLRKKVDFEKVSEEKEGGEQDEGNGENILVLNEG